MRETITMLGLLGFFFLVMFATLSQGNAGGLIMLVFIIPALYLIKGHLQEQERIRRREEWEKTPEGQAYLQEQKRLQEEKERIEKESRLCELEELQRRQKEKEEALAQTKWRNFHEWKTMRDVDEMNGLDFEKFLARLLTKMGYKNLCLTPINDQGGDLVGDSPKGMRVVVQAKRWKKPLGNAVVQELLGAMLHYGCQMGMIITNSTFTAAANPLAGKDPRLALRNRAWLNKQIQKHLPREIPGFNRAEYEQVVKNAFPVHSQKPGLRFRRRRRMFRKGRRW